MRVRLSELLVSRSVRPPSRSTSLSFARACTADPEQVTLATTATVRAWTHPPGSPHRSTCVCPSPLTYVRALLRLAVSYAAAFAIRTIPMLTKVDVASWWTFSDVFEEGWLTGAPFYGGFGLITSQGVKKPAYRAFELLAGAGTRRLREVMLSDPSPDYPDGSTVSVLATVDDGDGECGGGEQRADAARGHGCDPWRHGGLGTSALRGLQLFLANFGPEAGATAAPWQPKARNVSLRIELPPGEELPPGMLVDGLHCAATPSRALIRRIDDSVTNPLAVWKAMGSPQYPTASQLAQLHAASEVPEHVLPLTPSETAPPYGHARGTCGAVEVRLEIPAYGVIQLSQFLH